MKINLRYPITIYRKITDIYSTSLKFKIGFLILLALIVVSATFCLLAPMLAPPNYRSWYSLKKDLPPNLSSLNLILGTTTNGRSVFWALMHAIINSLIMASITALVASHIGLFLGMISGIKGGTVDRLLIFLIDVFIIIPGLPLLVVLTMSLKNVLTIPLLGLIISVIAWTWPARQVRAMVLSLREREHIYIARLSGMNSMNIIISEIFPHIVAWHLINFTNTVLFSISTEAGLAILGLSILSEDTLGTMIYWAQNYSALLRGKTWWIGSPIATLIVLFVSLYLISTGLSEYVNPRLRYGVTR
jgi:peptide/nickel transport system permease protein